MKKLGLFIGLMLVTTLISSNKRKQEKPNDLVNSLNDLKQSVRQLDSIIKNGKTK